MKGNHPTISDEIRIEDGVPVPGKGGGARSPLGRTMSKMKVGQSFCTQQNVNTIHSHANYYDIKVAYRTLENGEVRVWRIK
jgi:hypothetical protein